ncbi:glycosyltransferase family 39 protein [Flavobacteriaceae bacterium TK19130]|nr:glycosyltransferase family 39 protein [Thermobacterium salinum]
MRKYQYFILLAFTCLTVYFSNLNMLPVNIMEARNFITAREMVDDGNWLLTTLNGEPRYEKPPLPTWLTAVSGMVFGFDNQAGLRLPASLITIVLLLLFYKLSERITKDMEVGLIASLVLATSFYMVFAGRNGQWDIFTHGFMMIGIYSLYKLFTQKTKRYSFALLAGLGIGASFMSKGPVSFYALLLPFLIAYGFVLKGKEIRNRIGPLLVVLLVSVIVSGWWYGYVYWKDAEHLLAITGEETDNWTSYNIRPFYYYWSFFTQSGIWTIPAFISLLYPYLKDRVTNKKVYTFSLLWTLASVVLLSIIPEKKSRYLLPVLIPLALNISFYIQYLIHNFKDISSTLEKIPIYLHFGLVGLIGIAFSFGGYLYLQDKVDGFWVWYCLLAIALLGFGIFILKNLFQKNIRWAFYYTVLFVCSILIFGLPMTNTLLHNENYQSISALKETAPVKDLNIYEYNEFSPEIVWNYKAPTPVLKSKVKLELPSEETFGVLVRDQALENFEQDFQGFSVEKLGEVDMNATSPGSRSHRKRLVRTLYKISRK